MPYRATEESVRAIVEVDDDLVDLTPFIRPANLLVNRVILKVPLSDPELPEGDLTEIETWLSAHFQCILAPRFLAEQVDTIQTRIESKVDLALNVTRYGQMAMILDTTGRLATWNNDVTDGNMGAVALDMKWLGTDSTVVIP